MPNFTAAFDSATAMVISLSLFLEGKGFPGTGAMPANEPLGKALDMLPETLKKTMYAQSGRFDGLRPENTSGVAISELEKWVTQSYPDRKYPAIAIGSSNGALNHLYAALGIPWLPQTFLIPVRKPGFLDKDKPKEVIKWADDAARALLESNPGISLHHMMDPNHDRLHLNTITYFRVKIHRMGECYRQFIRDRLSAGGKVIIINCRQQWPVSRMDQDYVFQFGGAGGGIQAREYYEGSKRVNHFLKKQGAEVERWDAPRIDEEVPEAEWGYDERLSDEIRTYADELNIGLEEILFDHPETPSAYVADLYREWYRKLGREDDRLLIECFALHDPYWALRSSSVPLWMLFNDEQSAEFADRFLQDRKAFDEIFMMLMSHGTESIGLAGIDRWDHILKHARQNKNYIGVSRDDYPVNFGVYMRYFEDLQDKISARYPLPEPMPLEQARELLKRVGTDYGVRWTS